MYILSSIYWQWCCADLSFYPLWYLIAELVPSFLTLPCVNALDVCFVTQSCPTLWDLVDCNLPGSSLHKISQAKILKCVAISFSLAFSPPRDRTWVSCIARQILYQLSYRGPILVYQNSKAGNSHFCLIVWGWDGSGPEELMQEGGSHKAVTEEKWWWWVRPEGLEERTSRADICIWASGRFRHLCMFPVAVLCWTVPTLQPLSQAFLLFLPLLWQKKRERESQV